MELRLKSFLFIGIFILSLISVNAFTYNFNNSYYDYCYQETANSSLQSIYSNGNCYLNYTGSYLCAGGWTTCGNYYNANYSDIAYGGVGSNSSVPPSSGTSYINISLSKPSYSDNVSLIWRSIVYDGVNVIDINNTLDSNLMNNSNNIKLAVSSGANLVPTFEYSNYFYFNVSQFINLRYTTIRFLVDDGYFWYGNLTWNKTINYSLPTPTNGVLGETSDIILNLSKGTNQSYPSANLIYNGITYLGLSADYGSYVLFDASVNNNVSGNISYYWNVTLNDFGNTFNFLTVNGSQIVSGLNLNITIYDINTLKIINTSTSTVLFQSPSIDYSFTTPNGTLSVSGIKSGVYTLTVTNAGYNPDSSPITISSSSSSTINIYLSNTSSLFQFYLVSNLPNDNGNKISQGTCTFYYLNNGSSLQIGSFTTDFSGSGTIYLDTSKTYTYICQASGYLTYQNDIKPIVASSPYSIPMTSTGSTPYTNVLNGVVISTSSSYSYPSTTAYFYYNLNTVNGSTQYFGLSTNYNNTYLFQNNTGSATGGLLTLTVPNITLSNRTITITYWYKLVGYNYQQWNQTYYLPVIVGGNMTLSQGIFTGNNSITDTNTNPMNPIALGLIAVLIPIAFMIFMHMFGMPKVLVILAGLAGDGIIIMSNMFSQMPNSAKIGTVLAMSMTIIFMFLIADNKDSVGLN